MDKYPELTVFELDIIDRCLKEVNDVTHKKGLEEDIQSVAEQHLELNNQVSDLRSKIEKIKQYKMNEDS